MRAIPSFCLLAALAACRTSNLGACASDAQCPQGSVCDTAAAVCVAKQGACLPACDTAHLCNAATLKCDAAGTPQVTITSPADGATASGTLQASATASAPGGVTSVRFDLSRGATVVATAAGTASSSNPSSFSASLPLASVADGPASLTATLTAAAGTATSAAVAVTVDQTAPVITLQTDGTLAFYGAGQTATVAAQITDATSGVQDSTVALLIAGHAAIPGVPGSTAGAYTFSVLIDDTIVAAGASAAVHYQIVAADKAGQQASVSGDPREVIQADRDAPAISAVNYTPAAVAGPSGHLLLGGPAGGSVMVRATLTDFSGVGAACLRLAGETGACLHPGARLISTTWTFTLPDPAPPQDGTVATSFTIQADDTLAAALSGPSKLEHQASSAQTVYFDYGPTIAVFTDPAPYARTAIPIPVSALITDPSGVPDGGVFLNGTLPPSSRDGGLFVFQLDPRGAPAGVEGAYNFQVSATDNLSNTTDAGGSRLVDDAPPDASVRIFRGTDPGTGGVTYPAAVAGTGWDGTQFIYNDTVHVKGTLTDVSGVGAASVHIDGTDVAGAVTRGTPISLGCTAGLSPCTFDVQVALNAAGNGAFNSRGAMHPMGPDIMAPSGPLQVVVDAVDSAHAAGGADAGNAGSTTVAAQTTRLLWQMYLPNSVSGLGVHPDGDLIVTLDGGTDTVVALRPDDGGVHWSFGGGVSATGLGAVDGTPAIGAGDAGNARIYVAAQDGGIFAINPDGVEAWHYYTGDTLNVGPAVASPTADPVTDQVIVPGALATSKMYSIASGVLLNTTAPNVANSNSSSAPLLLGGAAYFGNATKLEMHPISALGALGAATVGGGTAVYREVITDGNSLFAWRSITSGFNSRDTSLGFNWSVSVTPTGAGAVALDHSIIVALASGPVNAFDPNPAGTGVNSTLFNLGGAGGAPLIAWDGVAPHEHFYFPRIPAFLFAYDATGKLSWEAAPNGTTYRAATMDCSGRLFAATNGLAAGQSLVYALITDDRGLADTAWPSYRLDARNTGNVGAPKYGILSNGTCSQ